MDKFSATLLNRKTFQTHTHTHKDPQVPLLVVWCIPGGGGPHVPALSEHSYCMLEGQLGAIGMNKEEEQTISVYQSSHSTLPTLLELRQEEHTSMELSIRLREEQATLVHLALSMTTMSHVQCVTLQHEKQL